MQAISSRISTPQSPLKVTTPSKVPAQEQGRPAVAPIENATEKAPQQAQAKLVLDQQALALVEREYQRSNQKQNDYDRPSAQNQSAVAAYQSIDNLAQRENVQQLLGVDFFA